MRVEVAREAATLALLALVAGLVCSRLITRLAAYFLLFGVWDLAFYFWLRMLIGWPASPMTWDLLFLIPVPWSAPVLAPCLVAAAMALFGVAVLLREPKGLWVGNLVLLLAGFAVTFVAFVWNSRVLLSGGIPEHFPWIVFSLGEALLLLSSSVTLRNLRN